MAEPPMPATTRPPGESHSSSRADSTFHWASRMCSGIASTSVSRSDASTASMAARSSRSASSTSEPECAIWQFHPREHASSARDDVLGADRDALSQHGTVRDLRAVSDADAGADDAVAQHALGPDLRALQHDAALHRAAASDGDTVTQHDEAPDVRARGDAHAALDDGGRHDATVDHGILGHREEAAPQSLCHRCRHVALDDVERALEIALRGADVEPVGVRDETEQAVADEPRPDLALDRHRLAGRDEVEDAALEDVRACRDEVRVDLVRGGLL